MTHQEMIDVIQAHRDGKEIEFRRHGFVPWSMAHNPVWNFDEKEYRVKPSPRERFYVQYEDGSMSQAFASRELAEARKAGTCFPNARVVCFREVLE